MDLFLPANWANDRSPPAREVTQENQKKTPQWRLFFWLDEFSVVCCFRNAEAACGSAGVDARNFFDRVSFVREPFHRFN